MIITVSWICAGIAIIIALVAGAKGFQVGQAAALGGLAGAILGGLASAVFSQFKRGENGVRIRFRDLSNENKAKIILVWVAIMGIVGIVLFFVVELW